MNLFYDTEIMKWFLLYFTRSSGEGDWSSVGGYPDRIQPRE